MLLAAALRHFLYFNSHINQRTEMEVYMKEINLRELYPSIYKTDTYVEVSDDVLEAIKAHERAEAACERKMYRYKAHYSLDRGDGIEHDALPTPEDYAGANCAGEAVCCRYGAARKTGKEDLCPFLSGHEQGRNRSARGCR